MNSSASSQLARRCPLPSRISGVVSLPEKVCLIFDSLLPGRQKTSARSVRYERCPARSECKRVLAAADFDVTGKWIPGTTQPVANRMIGVCPYTSQTRHQHRRRCTPARFQINGAVSMGRRNTRAKPACKNFKTLHFSRVSNWQRGPVKRAKNQPLCAAEDSQGSYEATKPPVYKELPDRIVLHRPVEPAAVVF